MNDLALPLVGEIAAFSPRTTKVQQAKLDAMITLAGKIHDWPLLERAIDAKIQEQAQFVGWYDSNVLRGRPEKVTDSVTISAADVQAQTGITKKQVSRWRGHVADIRRYRAQLVLAAYRKAELAPSENHRAEGTGENEWFTPPQYLAAARTVLGEIDLDPATHPAAQEAVQANEYFTREDDGLTQPWHGRVWLNPPYAQPAIGHFVEKLVAEYAAGRVTDAIILTHNYTDTAWFHLAAASAAAICLTRGRIRFVDAAGSECSPTQGQAFFYYGDDVPPFAETFGRFGLVVVRYDRCTKEVHT